MRIVLDTNVLVSALLFYNSDVARAARLALDHHDVLASQDTMHELKRVLQKPKLHKYADADKLAAFFLSYERITIHTEILIPVTMSRDPKDDKFLEVALNGGADLLITGDQDLLVLHPFQSTAIITPTEFLSRYT
jgi:putative PIN family toxin of toxin-antitoxin system